MNILINCSNLKVGGGIQVAHSFINELQRNPADFFFVVVLSSELKKQLNLSQFSGNFKFEHYDIRASSKNAIWGKNDFLDALVLVNKIDRVFTVFGPSYWKPKVKHICGFAKAHYLYKDSPFFKNLKLKSWVLLKLKEFFHLYDFENNAETLITENPDVTEKLKRLFKKDSIFTVTNNYNQIYNQEMKWEKTLNLPRFQGKYLLTISANYPHKNLGIIPKVIKELQNKDRSFNFKFVLTINETDLRIEEDLKKHIIFLGKVKINQCPFLYEQCDFMFLPTLLECFSASYAEAMKMQVPILTSELDFARGICGNSALYFDPMNPEEIAQRIINLNNNPALQKSLIKNGIERLKSFDSASERAKKYIDLIKNS